MHAALPFTALVCAVVAAVTLTVLIGACRIRAGRWLIAFLTLSLLKLVISFLPNVILEYRIGFWMIEHVLFPFGPALGVILSVSSWLSLLVFVAHHSELYGTPAEKSSVYELVSDGKTTRVSVKNGFSWPCFLLGPLWAWSKGMIAVGILLLVGNVFFYALAILLQHVEFGLFDVRPAARWPVWLPGVVVYVAVVVGWLFVTGFFANRWHQKHLSKRGFEKVS